MITALVRDMSTHLDGLQTTRASVEAWILAIYNFFPTITPYFFWLSCKGAIAAGKEGDDLLVVTQDLAAKISDYKKAASHCKKHAPKAKAKAAAQAPAEPQS